MTMTKREAKESLKELLQNSDAYQGIGLGKDCLSVLWASWASEDDQPPAEHEGWRVRVTYVDDIRPWEA